MNAKEYIKSVWHNDYKKIPDVIYVGEVCQLMEEYAKLKLEEHKKESKT